MLWGVISVIELVAKELVQADHWDYVQFAHVWLEEGLEWRNKDSELGKSVSNLTRLRSNLGWVTRAFGVRTQKLGVAWFLIHPS